MQTQVVESLRLPEHVTDGVVYDVFFEYDDHSDVCFDLYGTRTNYNGKHKVLSIRKLPYQIIYSYNMLLKPHEMNYLNNFPGNDFYLYDLTEAAPAAENDELSVLRELNYYYHYFPGIKQVFELLRLTLRRKLYSMKENIKK